LKQHPTVVYVAPFAVFIALRWLPFPPEWLAPVRFVLVAATLAVFSRRAIPRHFAFPIGSALLGVAVLAVWIAPDLLWGPGYRDFWLFHNGITGVARSTLPVDLKRNAFFIAVRVLESAILVPVFEELFWRGWLMRYAIRPDFESVPLGRYTAAFVLGGCVAFRRRARTLLGSRADRGRGLQLVARAHPQPGGLRVGARRHQCVAGRLRAGFQSVAVLAVRRRAWPAVIVLPLCNDACVVLDEEVKAPIAIDARLP
jgi:CAAX prenyl protease-like protein